MRYGSGWRNGRKLLHDFLNIRAVENLSEYQRKSAHLLLSRLVKSPEDFFGHIKL